MARTSETNGPSLCPTVSEQGPTLSMTRAMCGCDLRRCGKAAAGSWIGAVRYVRWLALADDRLRGVGLAAGIAFGTGSLLRLRFAARVLLDVAVAATFAAALEGVLRVDFCGLLAGVLGMARL